MNQKRDDNGGTGKHEQPPAELTSKPDEKLTLVVELGSPGKENVRPEYKEGRPYKWTYLGTQIVMAVVTSVGIAVAVFTLKDINKNVTDSHAQAIAAATQAQITQREFELSQRPWISLDPVQVSDLSFNPNGTATFTIKFLIQNTGHSPATHTQLQAKLIPAKFNESGIFKQPAEQQKRLCDSARAHVERHELFPFTLFPDQKTTRDAGMSMTPDEITKAKTDIPGAEGPAIFLIVVGCVDYQFPFEAGHHQTGFLYEVSRIDPRSPFAPSVIYPGITLKSPNVRLDPYAFGNVFYAD
jgi:hypothetical protein